MRRAAIDVGTNTVRLLVADVESSAVSPVLREQRITRLGGGVDATGALRDDAVQRTAGAVRDFAERAWGIGAASLRVAGTSALRDASNAAALARAIGALELEVLDGADEGRLSFLGATAELDGGPYLVCDIGGGSTEFARGHGSVESVWSADVGSVRLRERYMTSDPPTAGEVRGALTSIRHELLHVERDVGLVGDEQLIGVAGTVTTLAALSAGLDAYDADVVHGFVLTATAVEDWTERLLAMPVDRVRELPTMQPGRADVMCAGALILRETVRRWAFAELTVSERDILDGLVLDAELGDGAGLPDVGSLGERPAT